MLKKRLFHSRNIGTTLSKEDTLEDTYPMAGDKVLQSKAKVTRYKS